MKIQDIQLFEALPASKSCRRIDFDKAQVVPGFIPETYFLIVSGNKPWSTMTVQLVPFVYIDKPDYWEIEVIACQSGIGLPMTAPYSAVLELSGSRGKKGIEVIGASRKQRFDVP